MRSRRLRSPRKRVGLFRGDLEDARTSRLETRRVSGRFKTLLALLLLISMLAWRAPAAVTVEPTLAAAVTPAATAPFNDGTPYPGPLPLALPASGGTIQAEQFNGGTPEQAFHACRPNDQGSGSTYRSDQHDIDIYPAGAGNYFIRSSSPFASDRPAHNCPNASNFFSDYVKYSFTVGATGWYKVSAAARNGRVSTRVDDINKGLSPTAPNAWVNMALVPAVFLSAGTTHVLTIEMVVFKTDLDAVMIAPTNPDYPAPRVVSTPLTKDEVVIADAVVTDARFGAIPNKPTFNNRVPIQNALYAVAIQGGGTVFVPPGVYTLNGPITVPGNVTLRGDWSPTTSASGQTILAANVPARAIGNAFITLAGTNATLSHIGVWYPKQSFTKPVRFPPTIQSYAASVTVTQVTLYNSDQGVFFRNGSAADINTLKATCLSLCILDDGNREYAFLTNIKISNEIWAASPPSITRKPTSKGDRKGLHNWTKQHLTGIHLFRNDNLTVYGVVITDALRGIVTTATNCTPRCGTYGSFSKIAAGFDRRGAARPKPDVNRIMNTDLVPQAKGISYSFAPSRLPARTGATDVYNARSAPFSAHADGLTDDTAAIQLALTTAANAGGGTVYLPSGTYLVSTHLSIPTGVELRGTFTARHTAESVDATTLLAVEGQGTAGPYTDPAFISLQPGSGVRGISIRYPNQGFGTPAYPIVPFPYTMRSLGAATWIRDVSVANGYQIVDLATYRSDGFVVKNLWATALLSGVNAGGGSRFGWLERCVISYGALYESRHRNSPHSYGATTLRNHTATRVVAYYLGDIDNLRSLGAASFTVYQHLVGYRTSTSSPGMTNSTLFASSSDSAGSAGFILRAGTRISFLGLVAVSPYSHNHVSTATTFHGVASIYDAVLDGKNGVKRGSGTLHVFAEHKK